MPFKPGLIKGHVSDKSALLRESLPAAGVCVVEPSRPDCLLVPRSNVVHEDDYQLTMIC